MTNAHRRSGVILGLLLAAAVAGAAAVGCGEATIKTFQPCSTPTGVDPTFTGVLAVFQSNDCFNGTGCHNATNPAGAASQLALGGESPHEVYLALMAGGAQGQGADKDVVTGTNAAASLLLKKPLATDPLAHAGGKQFGSVNDPNYKTIFIWASSGALETTSNSGC